MITVAPMLPEFLKPEVANALTPVCYFIFYWTGIIISPEGLICFAGLLAGLLILAVSLVRLFADDASSEPLWDQTLWPK